MKSRIGVGMAAVALLLAGCGDKTGSDNGSAASGGPAASVAAPNGGDWTQVFAETPEGGFVMGNPNAPVKLLEYASLTCPHCAQFSAEATAPLEEKYIKSGRVSWEYRPFMIFPTDPGAFLLARCQGPAPFFLLTDQLYADQEKWIGKLQQLPQEQLAQIQGLQPQPRISALVKAAGLDEFFRLRGLPEAKVASCLSDQKALDRLSEITGRGQSEFGVTGTPSFFINGTKIESGGTWTELEPELKKALGE